MRLTGLAGAGLMGAGLMGAGLMGAGLMGAVLAASALAQRPPVQEAPLPPLPRLGQQRLGQERLGQQQPLPVVPVGPGQMPAPASLPAVAPPPATVERPNVWVPAASVRLQALDKVNAQTTALTIKVGESATFGSLTIGVKACMTRPADQPADAAAFLDVTDSRPDSPGFDGWMLQAEPSVSMLQHPIYDLRVAGCA
jgi:hypothetical protein